MVQGPTQLFLEMSMQTRVNIAAPRSHDQPLQRRQAHGRFDALTAENRTSAAAIAEMDADERARSQRFSEHTRRSLRYESMAKLARRSGVTPKTSRRHGRRDDQRRAALFAGRFFP